MRQIAKKKILTLQEYRSLQPYKGVKTVLVGGCFDIFHFGHLSFLQKAKKQGDRLIIALESDEFIIDSKRRPPVHTHMQRAQLLAELQSVDLVLLLPHFTSEQQYPELVSEIKPACIAVTEGDVNLEKKQHQAKSIGAKVMIVSALLAPFSTSQILDYGTIYRN
ncbi:adenylyltransferase/cytidyltransferase family protein [Candidatus Roizmanbacteria bacterium]|nr:adenylyltransferase/cytidyltransferase family protein [Candidatus Roizmanbacteria bacterium]